MIIFATIAYIGAAAAFYVWAVSNAPEIEEMPATSIPMGEIIYLFDQGEVATQKAA